MILKSGGANGRSDRRAFRGAVLASCLVHACVLVCVHVTWPRPSDPNDAIFEFILYDAIGGTAGGADSDDTVEVPQAFQEEESVAQAPQSETEPGANTPESPSEEMVAEEMPEDQPEQIERTIPEQEIDIEQESEPIATAKPDPVIVDTPTPLLDDRKPEEEELPLADVTPTARPKPRRRPSSEFSPPPAPPPAPLLLASVAMENPEEVLGGGGEGHGHGGLSGGDQAGNADMLRAYAGEIQRQLGMYKQYPSTARRNNIEGMVVVSFVVDTAGKVTNIDMVTSSGDFELDTEALSLPTRAAPMPGIPPPLRLSSIRLTMPIQFSLR